MKRFTPLLSALALCAAGTSGLAQAQQAEAPPQQSPAGEAPVAPLLYSGRFVAPVKLRDCWYFVSSEVPGRGAPAALTVRRLATPRCEAATKILQWTYDSGTLPRVTTKGDELVIAYSVKMWPYPLQGGIRLFHVSTDTLENLRTTQNELVASSGISASRVYFQGQDLVVQGARTGTLPGETGAGDYYTATFPRFLTGDAPPTLVAQADAPPAAPSDEISGGEYIPDQEALYLLPFKVKDCWYAVSAHTPIRGFGMYMLNVTRLAVNGCEGRTTVLDRSYDPRTLRVATKGESDIAIAWSEKSAPLYIDSPTSVHVYHISPETLANVRTANDKLVSSTGGAVLASSLSFQGHALVVEGTKDGAIVSGTPESGEGSHYTATFEHFLDGDAPPSVLAY